MKKLGPLPLIHPSALVRDSRIGAFTEIGERTKFIESTMDDYSYVVNDSDVIYTDIGKFCSIASHVRINPGNHPMHRASQSHFTYRASAYFEAEDDEAAFFAWRRSFSVSIGHDVWIGHGAIVLPGRTIGHGAVVAAGAIITKNVAPYSIVAGNPARHLKFRFSEAVINGLQSIAWWNWSHAQLQTALPDFRELPVEAFIEKYQPGPGATRPGESR